MSAVAEPSTHAHDDDLARRNALVLAVAQALAGGNNTVIVATSAIIGAVTKEYRAALRIPAGLERDSKVKNTHFVMRMMPFSSMRSLAMSSGGGFPYELAEGLAQIAAGHPIRGLRAIRSRRKQADA